MNINNIYPTNIDIKHEYIKINNLYVSHIIIQDLPREINMLDLTKIIPKNIRNVTSINVSKLDVNEQIKKLSKVIIETNSELKSIKNNLASKDVIKKTNEEALELRRKLQVENEDIYNLNIYIGISDINIDNLKLNINKLISNLYAKGIYAKVANFRQDLVYLDSLPILNINESLTKQTAISVTTSQNAYLIPYIKNNIYDNKGVLYGHINKEFCIYDIFSSNNMNHNMCILGSSGAGKSYFIKTIILRNLCMNITQIVFDIEEEYLNISSWANTIEFNINNFNPFYIPRIFVENNKENFLSKKIESIISFLNLKTNFKIREYENEIKSVLLELYIRHGIDDNTNSLYRGKENGTLSINREYMKYSEFPNIKELVNILENKNVIPKQVIKALRSIDMYKKYDENIIKSLDDKFETMIVFNMKSLGAQNFDVCLDFAEEYYGKKLLIYVDEVWKFMSENIKENTCKRIAELYKTIRKKKAGIIIISQDIHDILRYDNGTFGKSILNNSYTKLFFRMQYLDLNILKEIGIYSKEVLDNIKKLIIGTACMIIGDINFNIEIKTSEFEKKILGGEVNEESFSSYR